MVGAIKANGVGWIPIVYGLILAVGSIGSFVWSVLRGDVTPYMPFISEAGADPPQSGFFSLSLYLSSLFGLLTLLVRYLTIRNLNNSCSKKMDALNMTAAVVGVIAFAGVVGVAAYPVSQVESVHGIAADVYFFGLLFYEILQTILSFWMHPRFNGKAIAIVRTIITCFTLLSVICMIVLGNFGMSRWFAQNYTQKVQMKVPSNEGFSLIVSASSFEWLLGLTGVAFFFSFIKEFQKVCFEVDLEPLLGQSDDEDNFRRLLHETTPLLAQES